MLNSLRGAVAGLVSSMARLARVIAPGMPHHVTQRGNRRRQTFFGEEDVGQGTFQAASVPEPATLTLTAIGAFGLLFYRWRRPARAVAPPVARDSGTC